MRIPNPYRWSLMVVIVLSFASAALAQTAELSGIVTDQTHAVVPNATITLLSEDTGIKRTGTTNNDGNYDIPLIAPGSYKITVEATGFRTVTETGVRLEVAQNARTDFMLEVGATSQTVEVKGTAPLVERELATVSTVMDRRFVEELPLNGRSFHALLELTPGVVLTATYSGGDKGQFSVNGQRADANYFTIDGVSANFGAGASAHFGQTANGAMPALSILGGSNNLVSVDALQEFRIETSSYAPEFGRTSGGQIMLATRSGTNRFHGTAFDYVRNDVLDANDWFADSQGLAKPALRQNDFGGVFGGPIVKDRTFFFFSYEGLRLREPKVLVTDVPSTLARQIAPPPVAPWLNAWPIPNGPSTGFDINQFAASYSDPATLDAVSVRIDHTVSSRLNLFGRADYSPSAYDQRAPGGYAAASVVAHQPINTVTATGGADANITPALTNSFRFNYSRQTGAFVDEITNFGGAVEPPLSFMFPPGFGSPADSTAAPYLSGVRGGVIRIGHDADIVQRQIDIADTFLVVRGTHQMKFGVDFRRLTPQNAIERYYNGPNWSSGITGALTGVAIFNLENNEARPHLLYHNFSAFAQDAWKVSPKMTFTYGVRSEYNTPPTETTGNPPYALTQITDLSTTAVAPPGTLLWKATWANFAPRVGLSYLLSQNAQRPTVVRAGFGIFYDMGTGPTGDAFQYDMTPYSSAVSLPKVTLPYTGPPPPFTFKPPYLLVMGFDPHLKLPYTPQWSFGVERALSPNQTASVTYIGSLGRRLIRQDFEVDPNPTFEYLRIVRNDAYSNYNALQLQFRRHFSHGLQAQVGYTWSHSLDLTSNDEETGGGLPTNLYNLKQEYGDSDFDVRHVLTGAATYELPVRNFSNPVMQALTRSWALDGITRAYTPEPSSALYTPVTPYSFPDIGALAFRPDRVLGQPLYISDPARPGGKIVNIAAFAIPTTLRQGTEARNSLRGFNCFQTDLALRRQFAITERWKLLLRVESFNVFNHPNFANPNAYIDQPDFGAAPSMLNVGLASGSGYNGGFNPLYQIGGARSLQVSLKVLF